jgi:hypothetical protein
VAAFFFQYGRDNLRELIQHRLAVMLTWTSTDFSNNGKHG